jgi:hypothetical protein
LKLGASRIGGRASFRTRRFPPGIVRRNDERQRVEPKAGDAALHHRIFSREEGLTAISEYPG